MSLDHAQLLDLRDRLHMPEFSVVGGSAQLAAWLDQLDDAIEAGTVDPRPSWEIEAAEAAERVAKVLLAELTPVLAARSATATSPTPANDTSASSAGTGPKHAEDLLRAGDAGMSRRAWRGAIKRGELRASKIGREYMATRADYESYLAAKLVTPPLGRPRRKTHVDQASTAVERALASGRLRAIVGGRES